MPLQFVKNVTISENDVQQSLGNFEGVPLVRLHNKSEIKLKLLVANNALFLLHGYKLSSDQEIFNSDDANKSILVATVKDTNKLRAFLRGLGENIEVLEPESIRDYFSCLAKRLYKTYHNE